MGEFKQKAGLASYGVSFTGIMDLVGESVSLRELESTQSPAGRALNKELTPRGPVKIRRMIEEDAQTRREAQVRASWKFLTTGQNNLPNPCIGVADAEGKPIPGKVTPDGREAMSCRVYNPMPYDEARPKDIDMYEGTGIGLLYRIMGGEHMAWTLAGWNIGRVLNDKGGTRGLPSEQRARKK